TRHERKYRVQQRKHPVLFFGLRSCKYDVGYKPSANSQSLIRKAVQNRERPGGREFGANPSQNAFRPKRLCNTLASSTLQRDLSDFRVRRHRWLFQTASRSSASTTTETDLMMTSIDNTTRYELFFRIRIPSTPCSGPRRRRTLFPTRRYG